MKRLSGECGCVLEAIALEVCMIARKAFYMKTACQENGR